MKLHHRTIISALLCLAVFIASGKVGAQPGIPDAGQLDWLLLGPLDMPNQEHQWFDIEGFHLDYLKGLGGEAKARPLEGEQTAGKVWKRLQAPGMPIDFNQLVPGEALNAVVYAYTTFDSPAAQQIALKLGSDDGVKVWFNGVLFVSHHIHRSLSEDQEALLLPVQAGKNHLLVKVDQGYGGWQMTARFRSIMEEHADWEQVENAGLQIQPIDQIVQEPEEFFCTVSTVPAFAVQLPINIEMTDGDGNVLQSAQGFTGTPLQLPIAADFRGIATVRVTGLSDHLSQTTQQNIVFGDPKTIIPELLPQAKALAVTAGQQNHNALAATLEYYVDIIEGNLHADLITEQSVIDAITKIPELIAHAEQGTWSAAAFRGLHQWAYRSSIDESLQPYTLYVPQNYDPAQSYSLIVALHGYSGNDHSMASQIVSAGAHPDDFLVVAPYGRGDIGYLSIGEQDVLDVMDIVQNTFSVNPDRVYLVGSSMGGLGAWTIGQNYPEKFAAFAPFAGWTGVKYLDNLRNLPTLIVHGDMDNTVPIIMDRNAAERLELLEYPVRFDILPGGGHNALSTWMSEGGSERLYAYFRQHQRNRWPNDVVLKTNYVRYGHRYWVELLELSNAPTDGEIMASIVDAAHIRITTEGVNIFRLDLTNPNLSQEDVITISIDDTSLQVDASQESVTFQVDDEGWHVIPSLPTIEVRHDGGGLGDLFMRPLLVVYGTQARQEIYQKSAQFFADWRPTPAMRLGSKTGVFQMKADVDVTDDDMQNYDLLLIGGPGENSITGKIADRLPLRFADDWVEVNGEPLDSAGLLLTCPNPEAPSRLVSVLTLPFSDSYIQRFSLMTSLNFRTYRSDQLSAAPRPFPDVAVFAPIGNNIQVHSIGWFDYAWQDIRWQGAQ